MEHTAAAPEGEAHESRLRAIAADVGPKLFITIVAAGISALLIPWITGKWQDHKQQLEVRTSLAADMSRAYTDVIASERFVAFGLVYSAGKREEQVATNVNAWLTAWHDWLVEAGTLGAQLTARYGVGGIATEWQEYIGAVSAYIRLGAEIPAAERPGLIAAAEALRRRCTGRLERPRAHQEAQDVPRLQDELHRPRQRAACARRRTRAGGAQAHAARLSAESRANGAAPESN